MTNSFMQIGLFYPQTSVAIEQVGDYCVSSSSELMSRRCTTMTN